MEYRKLEVSRLKELCSERNLPFNGGKETLVKRLRDSDNYEEKKNQLDLIGTPIVETKSSLENRQTKKLFIHLKAANISHYFNAGIIYPIALEESEIYVSENRKRDVFTLFQDNIVLSSGALNNFEDDDALLDVITEDLDLIPISSSELYRCETPIPLSRVRAIVFNSSIARSTFISSAKTFPDFFVEEKMCHVTTRSNIVNVDFEKINIPSNEKIARWHDILDRYDKLLGMFGFMKNAGMFYADRTGYFEEYSQSYLAALSVINTSIGVKSTRDIALYKYIVFPGNIELTTIQRLLFQMLLKAVYQNVELDMDFAINTLNAAVESKLASREEQDELRSIIIQFERLKTKQISYKDITYHHSISKNLPVMALLFLSRFPNKSRQHTDKQAVRNNFIENNSPLSKGESEFLLAVLGLYYGYKSMIKEDTNFNPIDPFFSSLSKRYQSIKFKVGSYFDRLVMESAYRFAIDGVSANGRFPYLDSQQPEFSDNSSVRTGAYEYQNLSYRLLDTPIAVFQRINKVDIVLESIGRRYAQTITSNSMLLQYVLSEFGISKELLFKVIRENSAKLNLEEIDRLIEFDKRLKDKP